MTAEPLSDVPLGLDLLRETYTYCADSDPELPVVISLFSGIEGIGAGLVLNGFDVVIAVEWDPECQRVIRARFPNCRIYSDVREVDVDELREIVGGRRCVVVGGFPCQDVSVAGGRAGVAGTRSGLYVELVRIADALDPDWLVVENVAGLLSADLDPEANDGAGWGRGTAMAVVLRDITGWAPPVPADGWRNSGVCVGARRSAAWRVLDARHTGVAQRRRRVFVVACPRDRTASAAVLLEPEGVRGNSPSGEPPRPRSARRVAPTVVRAGGAAADGAGTDGPRAGVLADEGVTSALTAALGAGGPDAAHAHAGWMVPTGRDVTAALTAANHDYDRGDTASDSRLLVEGVGLGADTSVAGTLGTPRDGGDTTGLDGKAAYVVEPQCVTGETTHALTSEGADASEDGTGRGTPIVTAVAIGSHAGSDGEASNSSHASGGPVGMGVSEDEAFALRAGRTQAVATEAEGDVAPTLNVNDVGDTRATVTIVEPQAAMSLIEGAHGVTGDDLAGSVQTAGGKPGQGYQAVAFAVEPERGQGADLRARETDLSPAVTVTDHAKQTDRGVRVTQEAAVRRLTPIECARLQGFPDPWLQGLGLSDSAQYRMLGNAVCVSVSALVGWRLAAYVRGWRP